MKDAKQHLVASGLAIREALIAEVAAGRITGVKKIHVQDVLDEMAVGPRRVAELLIDLDGSTAHEAIERLLQTNPDGFVQRMLQEAKERRKWSLRP